MPRIIAVAKLIAIVKSTCKGLMDIEKTAFITAALFKSGIQYTSRLEIERKEELIAATMTIIITGETIAVASLTLFERVDKMETSTTITNTEDNTIPKRAAYSAKP